MNTGPARYLHTAVRRAELFAFDVLRFFIRVLGGQDTRDRFDSRYLIITPPAGSTAAVPIPSFTTVPTAASSIRSASSLGKRASRSAW
jgi:hypothetical protein